MLNKLFIFALRLSAIDGINRQSITRVHPFEPTKNTRHAVKLSRVSFFNLIIQSPYRWLVKVTAQLQFIRLLDQINVLIGRERKFLGGAFLSLFFLCFFFSLSLFNNLLSFA